MSTAVREREREREWDSRSSFHEDRPRGSVTIRRYKVPDREDESDRFSHRDSPRRSDFRESSDVREVREVRYERDVDSRPRDRDRDRDLWEYRSERARSPPRDDYREVRIEREISREPPRRDRGDFELDHYTKTTDYYGRDRDAPQPIYIRNDAPAPIIIRESAPAPIIIREERERARSPRSEYREREERRTEVDHRSEGSRRTEVDRRTEIDQKTEVEDRTMVKREPSPQQEDEYYYQKTTRELARRDDYDDYKSQREVRGRDRESHRSRRDESEDWYYRREEVTTDRERARSKSRHRIHLAEGALAGAAAGGLLNRQRKREGGSGGGLRDVLGGAVIGGIGTEVVSRAKSKIRGDSRSRSGSREARHRHRGDSRDRSRSRSHSKEGFWNNTGNLGKFGAVAAVAGLAGYALSRRGRNKDGDDDRRSRSIVRSLSRGRSGSAGSDSAMNPHHRNITMAKAGLASAAAAGVVERIRSRSRGGRSRSILRNGAPIAAAGLGGAALAGLYERHKASKEEREVSRSRSRGARSMSRGDPYRSGSRGQGGDRNLIEYGDDPIPPSDPYERSRSTADSHYGEYAARRRSRSSSGSPAQRRYASRSRSRSVGDVAAGAGMAGVAAHEASQHRDRRRAERQRHEQETQATGAGYGFGPYGQEPPPAPMPPGNQGEYPQQQFQPYQPPEGYQPPNAYSPMPQFVNSNPQGNGYDEHNNSFPPPPQQQQQPAGAAAPAGGYYPPPPGQYNQNHVSQPPREAAETARAVGVDDRHDSRGLRSETSSSNRQGGYERFYDEQQSRRDVDRFRAPSRRDRPGPGNGQKEDTSKKPRNDKRRGTTFKPDETQHSNASSDTIVLPDRFDNKGRRIPQRDDAMDSGFNGAGLSGLLGRVAHELMGGGSGAQNERDRRRPGRA